MRRTLRWQLLGLAAFVLVVAVLAYPREGDVLGLIGIDHELSIQRGLDLQGGVELIYEAEIPEDAEADEVLTQTALVMRRRVDPAGTSEAIIREAENNRIIIQLPDEENPQEARELIGQTAQLEFFEVNPQAQEAGLTPTELDGDDVSRADAAFDQTNRPVVNLRLESGDSTRQFADLTTRIYNADSQLLILLDGEPVFGPATVSEPLRTGEATLTGQQSIEEAQQIADLIEGGALPVPVELVSQQTIGPSLGEEAASSSVIAGFIGLLSLAIFLLVVYKLGGTVAVAAMGIYTLTMVTVFKLTTLPIFADFTIVLTLAGIAGFIMSAAVAADANILVLERLREERQAGMQPAKAVETGFDHAWSSIRDASIATLILCAVLYTLASQFGESSIQGFALILGLGVAINVTSVQIVTKTLLRGLVRSRLRGRI